MEKPYSINNLKHKLITDINNNQTNKKREYITKEKIKQNKSKIIVKEKNKIKLLKILSNKATNSSEKEIVNTAKNISKTKINFDKIQPINIKKNPDNNSPLRINTFLQNKIKNFYFFSRYIILKNFYFFSRYIILLIIFFPFFANMNQENISLTSIEVTLKVKGSGYIKILSDSFFKKYNQCEIYINGILQNETKNEYEYNFTNSEIDNSSNPKNEDYISKSEIDNSDISLNEYNLEKSTEIEKVEQSTTEYYLNNPSTINSNIQKNEYFLTDLESIYINTSIKENFFNESDSIIFDDEEIENSDIYLYNYSNSSRNKNDLEKEKDIYDIKIVWNDTFITTI